MIEIFDIERLERIGAVATEEGAHTFAVDPDTHRVIAFLPSSGRAVVFAPEG